MARVVNTDTTLGRRANIQRLGLVALYLTAVVLVVNLGRGVVREMGGVDHIREAGVVKAAAAASARVFTFSSGHLPPHAIRQLAMLGVHVGGLVAVSQLIWLPLAVLRGYGGQRRVLDELRRLPDEYFVLNDLLVPGQKTRSQVDHVVVSPYGVWCLETQAHTGCVVGGEHDYEWRQYRRGDTVRAHGNRFFNPVRQNSTHCAHVADQLGSARVDVPVRSMVVFTEAEIDTMTMTPVEPVGNLVQAILQHDTERVLDDHDVERAVGVLSNLLATKASRRTAASAAPPVEAD